MVEALGRAVVQGKFNSGDSLPNEALLGSELGASRTIIREAVKVIASKGLLEPRPKTGTRVLPRRCWSLMDADVMRWQLESDAREVATGEMLEVRTILEPPAAGVAAILRSDEDVRHLEELVDTMGRCTDDLATYAATAVAFHASILTATHNELLAQMANAIGTALMASSRFSLHAPCSGTGATACHRAVVDAIRARDPGAASRAMGHLLSGGSGSGNEPTP